MKSMALSTLAVAAVLASGAARAVPCGPWETTGGIYQATACRDAPTGDRNDSAADLNGGGYFGFNDWIELSRTSDDTGSEWWNIEHQVGRKGLTGYAGTFTLSSDIWNWFKDVVVVLKDGGSFTNPDIKWSAYLLPQDQLGVYNWSYDGGHKQISHLTLYARYRPVSEPASLALALAGVAGVFLALRRRESAARAR